MVVVMLHPLWSMFGKIPAPFIVAETETRTNRTEIVPQAGMNTVCGKIHIWNSLATDGTFSWT
jgi:hypothetical protein